MQNLSPEAILKKAQQEAYYRGNLSWKLHTAQKVINEAYQAIQNQLFVGNCSRQFGKTFWAVCKAVEMGLSFFKCIICFLIYI